MKYKYVQLVHQGEDYIGLQYRQYGSKHLDNYVEVSGIGMDIIQTLLRRIAKMERLLSK